MEWLLNTWLVAVAVQVFYYLFFFARLNFVRSSRGLPGFLPPASVIICARNEAKNLLHNLKVVLIQQYPQFEVIVVNDQSTDNTPDVLVDFYQRNKNLKIVNIPAGEKKVLAGKRHALLKGIEAATFDTLVFTDADCRPATTHWLAKLVGSYMEGTGIVIGHAPFEKGTGFTSLLARYENFMTALQSFGFAKAGIPYMGIGRNLSYRKSIFTAHRQQLNVTSTLSGDDDLLVNKAATAANTEVCMDKDAFTYSPPKQDFAGWIQQKKRHLRAGFHYRLHHRLLLFLFALSLLVFYAGFAALLAAGCYIKWMVVIFVSALALRMAVTFRLHNKLATRDLKFSSLLLDPLYAGYLLIVFFLLLLQPKDKWT